MEVFLPLQITENICLDTTFAPDRKFHCKPLLIVASLNIIK